MTETLTPLPQRPAARSSFLKSIANHGRETSSMRITDALPVEKCGVKPKRDTLFIACKQYTTKPSLGVYWRLALTAILRAVTHRTDTHFFLTCIAERALIRNRNAPLPPPPPPPSSHGQEFGGSIIHKPEQEKRTENSWPWESYVSTHHTQVIDWSWWFSNLTYYACDPLDESRRFIGLIK